MLGSVAGIWLGLMMARSPVFRAYAAPIVGGTYSLPKSALIPLFILWFGIGTVTTVCAVFLACLLPMVVNTAQGVESTPRVLVWGAEAFGTPPRAMLWAGLSAACRCRISLRAFVSRLGFSFVLAISSEMIASTNGIGKLIFMYGENGAYDYMFAAHCLRPSASRSSPTVCFADADGEKPSLARIGASIGMSGTMTANVVSRSGLFVRSLISVLTIVVIWKPPRAPVLRPRCSCRRSQKWRAEWWSVCADGSLPQDLLISLSRAAIGLCLATAIGVPLGIATARSRVLHWLFDPVIALAFPSPKSPSLPIFILWFGIYSLSKILLVAFACVFPILIGSFAAASSVKPSP